MKRVLREPLFHFLLIGGLLFGVFGLLDRDGGTRPEDNRILVSAGRVEQIAAIFERTWQRPPTEEELKGLIDDFVLEEIYYREAKAMGLDRDDTIVRRRLRQKLEFMTDDTATLATPTDEELADYLSSNPDKFRSDTLYTFQQVYINPDKHPDDLDGYVARQKNALRAGAEPVGDSGLFEDQFQAVPGRIVDRTFGAGFASRLDALQPGDWQGPLPSGLGLHLVRVGARVEGTVPDLEEIRAAVQREWTHERRLEIRRAQNRHLLERYEVVVEAPPAGQNSPEEVARQAP